MASQRDFQLSLKCEPEPDDPWAQRLADAEAKFFDSSTEMEAVRSARRSYPRQKQEEEGTISRRIMGFGLGFEKIFTTTSYNLPISAHTIFAEMHSPKHAVAVKRLFNGHNSVFDLKKWIFEQLHVPMDSYELSYAEAGKANLGDQLPLLTTHDSLDTRTLATTRAVHSMFRGTPAVHSLNDVGITKLYARLKCRKSGDLLNGSQAHPKMPFNEICGEDVIRARALPSTSTSTSTSKIGGSKIKGVTSSAPNVDVGPPAISDDENFIDCVKVYRDGKFYYFHTRGYDLFEAARVQGVAELARIDLSCEQWPSTKARLGQNVLRRACPEPRH